MAQHILYPQWRDQFEATTYPFGARARLRNDGGDFFVEGTFLDAHLYPIGTQDRLFLSQVTVAHDLVTLYVGDTAVPLRAWGTFPLTNPPDTIVLVDAYNRPAGVLISQRQRLALFQTWGEGDHVFVVTDTEFAATCCLPVPEVGVRGILLADGSFFAGRVWIVGDDGIVVRSTTTTVPPACGLLAEDLPTIRVDVVGDPLYRRRLCEPHGPGAFTTPNPVRSLRIRNGDTLVDCQPDASGNISIQMNDSLADDTALRIRVSPEGIVFEVVGSQTTGASNA